MDSIERRCLEGIEGACELGARLDVTYNMGMALMGFAIILAVFMAVFAWWSHTVRWGRRD